MLYLDDDHVFSVEPPICKYWRLADLHDQRITLWHYTKREISESDVQIMLPAADQIIDTKYDIGQLLDMMINRILHYDSFLKYKVFDAGKSRKVCSTGVRVVYEHLRKTLNTQTPGTMTRLFSKYKDPAWALRPNVPDMNTQKRGVDVEATAPGHFANSHFFDDEFQLIAEYNYGEQIYP
jgi:hypothetical protein